MPLEHAYKKPVRGGPQDFICLGASTKFCGVPVTSVHGLKTRQFFPLLGSMHMEDD